MNPVTTVGLISFALHVFFYVVFALAVVKKNNGLADIAWGTGFIIVSWLALLLTNNWSNRPVLVFALVLIWGVRLSWHIWRRSRGRVEDFRYAKWRREWGNWWVVRSYFQVFFLQASLLLLIASPIMLIALRSEGSLTAIDFLGYLIWSIGFFFEAGADHQLAEFKRNPANKGKIMTKGLWQYSRHPNYFGEALLWWGIFVMAAQLEYGWVTVLSPVLIGFLLITVSGVPLLEKKYRKNPAYQEYQKRTSFFIPWFPKKS